MPEKKIFAEYFSPGTMFAETSTRALDKGSVKEAISLSKKVSERHGATPYAFDIVTKLVADPIDDGQGGTMKVFPKEIGRKGRYYLGGEVITYDQVIAREGAGSIWAMNMRGNRDPVSVQNTNSYKSTQIFREQDVIVDVETGAILVRGDDSELVQYRTVKIAEWDARAQEAQERAQKARGG